MLKALLYGYCIGVSSSTRVAQRLHEDIAFRVLAANNTPDFRTISDFCKDHLAGLVKLGHVALDGTKVRANASKHKAMSYWRRKRRKHSWRLGWQHAYGPDIGPLRGIVWSKSRAHS